MSHFFVSVIFPVTCDELDPLSVRIERALAILRSMIGQSGTTRYLSIAWDKMNLEMHSGVRSGVC